MQWRRVGSDMDIKITFEVRLTQHESDDVNQKLNGVYSALIKANAPHDATHYHPVEPLYCKFGKAYELFVWMGGAWIRAKPKVKRALISGLEPL